MINLVVGGSGYIGQRWVQRLLERKVKVIVYSRNKQATSKLFPDEVEVISDLSELGSEPIETVFNFSGAPIADARWSKKRKKVLSDSRVGVNEMLFNYFKSQNLAPNKFFCASAIGFYGDQGDKDVTEETPPVDEYTHQLCQAWENTAEKFSELGTKVTLFRLGVVIGKNSGFLSKLLLPFKFGLGGNLGDGQQWLSWVSIDDVLGAIEFLLDNDLNGVYNLTSPEAVRNETFTKTFAKLLGRPSFCTLPAPVLKILFGEMSEILLHGQKVQPKKLRDAGYQFKAPNLSSCLKKALTA